MSGVEHLGFIVAAYLVTAVMLLATVAALLLDLRTQKRLLKQFGEPEGGGA